MAIEETNDKRLRDGKRYKIRSMYEKNDLIIIKFETKYGLIKGTYKKRVLSLNPETNREKFYDEIEAVVNKLYDREQQTKKYVTLVSDKIDKVIDMD